MRHTTLTALLVPPLVTTVIVIVPGRVNELVPSPAGTLTTIPVSDHPAAFGTTVALIPVDDWVNTTFRYFIGWTVSAFRSRQDLILENLALRQQLIALHAKRPRRRLSARQKLLWVVLRQLWQGWKKPLALVHRELWSSGIVPGLGCIGSGSPEPGDSEAGSR